MSHACDALKPPCAASIQIVCNKCACRSTKQRLRPTPTSLRPEITYIDRRFPIQYLISAGRRGRVPPVPLTR